tara:strand:- start:275 stop:787 length:513 start_codon:yes stop_codon:yes gene_type:complete
MRRVNNELLKRIIGIQVGIYKLAVSEMTENIYGESDSKQYYNPMRVHALINIDPTIINVNEAGELDSDKSISIGFLRDELVALNLILEISDIIEWDGGYYQVDNVRTSNHWWGRNPDTSIPIEVGESGDHGWTISVIVEAHRTSIPNLNLIENRSGTNSTRTKSVLPKNL